ncbi:hypothetical protein JOY44_12800 [Phormidium sp. CLA17]|uniref:DUF6745 domain-containing protein n=1 Tax=Leptolyngbya sp. Cla-17 TaxID=2803751 RepID=UPI001491947C|nr:hypothetical protein [Leptolyngbya sp. Cla-17]MBM0742483.1 hypothetical protein [Leptolyngbya sp. Cla-17]
MKLPSNQKFPELENLLPFYQNYWQKWEGIGFCTTRIDRQSVTEVVKAVYKLNGFREPEVLFYDSPYEPWNRDFLGRLYLCLEKEVELRRRVEKKLGRQMEKLEIIDGGEGFQYIDRRNRKFEFSKKIERLESKNLLKDVMGILRGEIDLQLLDRLAHESMRRIAFQTDETGWGSSLQDYQLLGWRCRLEDILQNELTSLLGSKLHCELAQGKAEPIFYTGSQSTTPPDLLTSIAATYDFAISTLNYSCDDERWKMLQILAQNSNYIFSYKDVCVVCDRPLKFSVDGGGYLHAEGEPAILFADGFAIYACHGNIVNVRWQDNCKNQ